MSSGFVSGGSLEKPNERDEEWLKAQRELEEERKRKAQLEQQQGGKSLFEILQANKAAKQDAFEEAAKLKNQFRSLDDADIEHLTSVEESVRARERAVKEETTEQLAAFRKHQDELERLALLSTSENAGLAAANVTVEAEDWTAVGRKRKGGKEKEGFRGLKRKKISSSGDKPESADPEKEKELEAAVKSEDLPKKEAKDQVVSSKTGSTGKKAAPSGLGLLAGYSSDSDN